MKFEIYKDSKGFFRFRLRAKNSEIVASGEAYESKQSCKKGINAIKKCAKAKIVELS